MNIGDTEETPRSFARGLSRLATIGGRAMKRGVSRDFDKETMKTNMKLFVAMGLTWIVGMYFFISFLFQSKKIFHTTNCKRF